MRNRDGRVICYMLHDARNKLYVSAPLICNSARGTNWKSDTRRREILPQAARVIEFELCQYTDGPFFFVQREIKGQCGVCDVRGQSLLQYVPAKGTLNRIVSSSVPNVRCVS